VKEESTKIVRCPMFLLFVGFIKDSMREIMGCINVKLPVVRRISSC
jgi:hypothetical protein